MALEEKKVSDWMTTQWRPMMAMTYMAINIFDFIIGPILLGVAALTRGQEKIEALKHPEV